MLIDYGKFVPEQGQEVQKKKKKIEKNQDKNDNYERKKKIRLKQHKKFENKILYK